MIDLTDSGVSTIRTAIAKIVSGQCMQVDLGHDTVISKSEGQRKLLIETYYTGFEAMKAQHEASKVYVDATAVYDTQVQKRFCCDCGAFYTSRYSMCPECGCVTFNTEPNNKWKARGQFTRKYLELSSDLDKVQRTIYEEVADDNTRGILEEMCRIMDNLITLGGKLHEHES